jgi:hypothetical protein
MRRLRGDPCVDRTASANALAPLQRGGVIAHQAREAERQTRVVRTGVNDAPHGTIRTIDAFEPEAKVRTPCRIAVQGTVRERDLTNSRQGV